MAVRPGSSGLGGVGFVIQQPPLDGQPIPVSAQTAVCRDHTMAGHERRHVVGATSRSHRTSSAGSTDDIGHLPVTDRLARRECDAARPTPDPGPGSRSGAPGSGPRPPDHRPGMRPTRLGPRAVRRVRGYHPGAASPGCVPPDPKPEATTAPSSQTTTNWSGPPARTSTITVPPVLCRPVRGRVSSWRPRRDEPGRSATATGPPGPLPRSDRRARRHGAGSGLPPARHRGRPAPSSSHLPGSTGRSP